MVGEHRRQVGCAFVCTATVRLEVLEGVTVFGCPWLGFLRLPAHGRFRWQPRLVPAISCLHMCISLHNCTPCKLLARPRFLFLSPPTVVFLPSPSSYPHQPPGHHRPGGWPDHLQGRPRAAGAVGPKRGRALPGDLCSRGLVQCRERGVQAAVRGQGAVVRVSAAGAPSAPHVRCCPMHTPFCYCVVATDPPCSACCAAGGERHCRRGSSQGHTARLVAAAGLAAAAAVLPASLSIRCCLVGGACSLAACSSSMYIALVPLNLTTLVTRAQDGLSCAEAKVGKT